MDSGDTPVRVYRRQTDPIACDVGQGELGIGAGEGRELTATLGSCVAVCLFDPTQGIGGMTHIYQFVSDGHMGDAAVIAEVERLVNQLMHVGVSRRHLIAKVVGGAHVLGRGKRHGLAMADACLRYLAAEGVPLIGLSIGGEKARRIRFRVTDGELLVTYIPSNAFSDDLPTRKAGHGPEFF